MNEDEWLAKEVEKEVEKRNVNIFRLLLNWRNKHGTDTSSSNRNDTFHSR